MAEWAKAAEMQLELHRWLLAPEKGTLWLRHWIAGEKQAEPLKGDMYQTLAFGEPEKLLVADSIWVDKEMSELIEVAREEFEPEQFINEDLLVHTGFVYFEQPLFILDRNKRKLSIGAFSWCPFRVTADKGEKVREESPVWQREQSGMEITAYGSDVKEDVTGIALTLYTCTNVREDDYFGQMQTVRRDYGAPELIPLHFTPVFFGEELDDGTMFDEYGRYTGADEWWRTIQVTLRLMQQRIVTHMDVPLPRAARRRIERSGHKPRDVCVIRLRRSRPKKHGDEEVGSGRTLTHRHIREGHWRWQFYPSQNVHRQIRIQRTIVGDDSLPLIVKRRFYKWDR